MKKIAVITSGGDAPGMNAAVRAVVRSALHEGMEVLGSVRGYNGLIHDELIEMSIRSVSDTIHRGGTSLFTARSPEFRTEEGMQKAVDTCKRHGIEGVVVIGGDGSFRGARDLTARGIPCIGVTWGYGLLSELEAAGADVLAASPEALSDFLLS